MSSSSISVRDRVETSSPPSADVGHKPRRWDRFTAWLLLSPSLAILILMTLASAIYVVYISFHRIGSFGEGNTFVGLRNYTDAFTTNDFGVDLLHTALFVVVVVALELILGITLGILLAQRTRGNSLASALFVIPFAATPAATALVARAMLDPNTGWVDYYLQRLHLISHPIQWLSNTSTAWAALIILDVWQWTPFVALIVMAGVQSLPTDVSEAAQMDGASAWQALWHVTLPMLRPFIAIAGVLRVIQAFKTFDIFQIVTNGGPGTSTEVVNLELYRLVLKDYNLGAGAAISIMFLVVLLLLTPLLLRTVGKYADHERSE